MSVKNRLQFFSKDSPNGPFRISESIVNSYLCKTLDELGFQTEVVTDENFDMHYLNVPTAEVGAYARQMAGQQPAYRFFSNLSQNVRHFQRTSQTKNILFFHGVASNYNTFLFKENGFDFYCGNSQYLFELLQSLLFCPVSLSPFKFLNSIGEGNLATLTWVPLCVPAIDQPDGYSSEGRPVPEEIWKLFDEPNTYFSHSLRFQKADSFAHVSIMYLLNQIGRQMNPPLQFKQFVMHSDVQVFLEQASKMGLGAEAANCFIPMPRISNIEMLNLMGRCSFSLCYDKKAESFALYPLESIISQTPVYTNGVGNIRRLLPEGHGLTTVDTPDMHFGEIHSRVLAYSSVAKRIISGIFKPESVEAECSRGIEYVKEHYSLRTFKARFKEIMKRVDESSLSTAINAKDLKINLSPLVRSLDPKTGRVVSDFENTEISKEQISVIEEVRGRSLHQFEAEYLKRLEPILLPLFHKGVLSFLAPQSDALRF